MDRQHEHRNAVRTSRKAVWMGKCAGWLTRVVAATLRIKVIDRCGLTHPGDLPRPVVWVLWHNRVFAVPAVWYRWCRGHRQGAVLTSASHDGAALAAAVGVFGIRAVRGSSSRRALAAMVGLRQVLLDGKDICLTPDGPRGPRYVLQPGAVKLAQAAGVPVVPVHVVYSSAWRLNTWDGMVIPRPFSRITVTFDEPLAVPPDLDESGFELVRATLEERLRAGTDDQDFVPKPKRKRKR